MTRSSMSGSAHLDESIEHQLKLINQRAERRINGASDLMLKQSRLARKTRGRAKLNEKWEAHPLQMAFRFWRKSFLFQGHSEETLDTKKRWGELSALIRRPYKPYKPIRPYQQDMNEICMKDLIYRDEEMSPMGSDVYLLERALGDVSLSVNPKAHTSSFSTNFGNNHEPWIPTPWDTTNHGPILTRKSSELKRNLMSNVSKADEERIARAEKLGMTAASKLGYETGMYHTGGLDLRCVDLSDRMLPTHDPDFHLRKANLAGSWLKGTQLSNVDLRGASLHQTDLSGAKLRFADVRGANFNRAVLSNDTSLEGTIFNKFEPPRPKKEKKFKTDFFNDVAQGTKGKWVASLMGAEAGDVGGDDSGGDDSSQDEDVEDDDANAMEKAWEEMGQDLMHSVLRKVQKAATNYLVPVVAQIALELFRASRELADESDAERGGEDFRQNRSKLLAEVMGVVSMDVDPSAAAGNQEWNDNRADYVRQASLKILKSMWVRPLIEIVKSRGSVATEKADGQSTMPPPPVEEQSTAADDDSDAEFDDDSTRRKTIAMWQRPVRIQRVIKSLEKSGGAVQRVAFQDLDSVPAKEKPPGDTAMSTHADLRKQTISSRQPSWQSSRRIAPGVAGETFTSSRNLIHDSEAHPTSPGKVELVDQAHRPSATAVAKEIKSFEESIFGDAAISALEGALDKGAVSLGDRIVTACALTARSCLESPAAMKAAIEAQLEALFYKLALEAVTIWISYVKKLLYQHVLKAMQGVGRETRQSAGVTRTLSEFEAAMERALHEAVSRLDSSSLEVLGEHIKKKMAGLAHGLTHRYAIQSLSVKSAYQLAFAGSPWQTISHAFKLPRSKLMRDRTELEFVKNQIHILSRTELNTQSWRDVFSVWRAILRLRAKVRTERAQAIVEDMISQPDVLSALGCAQQLFHTRGEVPIGLLTRLQVGPMNHMRSFSFEYLEGLDLEMERIERIKTIKNQIVGLGISGMFALMFFISNLTAGILIEILPFEQLGELLAMGNAAVQDGGANETFAM